MAAIGARLKPLNGLLICQNQEHTGRLNTFFSDRGVTLGTVSTVTMAMYLILERMLLKKTPHDLIVFTLGYNALDDSGQGFDPVDLAADQHTRLLCFLQSIAGEQVVVDCNVEAAYFKVWRPWKFHNWPKDPVVDSYQFLEGERDFLDTCLAELRRPGKSRR